LGDSGDKEGIEHSNVGLFKKEGKPWLPLMFGRKLKRQEKSRCLKSFLGVIRQVSVDSVKR
jgi:hypothetical protein